MDVLLASCRTACLVPMAGGREPGQAQPGADRGRLGAVAYSKLAENAAGVHGDGAFAAKAFTAVMKLRTVKWPGGERLRACRQRRAEGVNGGRGWW
jgi:hypothetical protein